MTKAGKNKRPLLLVSHHDEFPLPHVLTEALARRSPPRPGSVIVVRQTMADLLKAYGIKEEKVER